MTQQEQLHQLAQEMPMAKDANQAILLLSSTGKTTAVTIKGDNISIASMIARFALQNDKFFETIKDAVAIVEEQDETKKQASTIRQKINQIRNITEEFPFSEGDSQAIITLAAENNKETSCSFKGELTTFYFLFRKLAENYPQFLSLMKIIAKELDAPSKEPILNLFPPSSQQLPS